MGGSDLYISSTLLYCLEYEYGYGNFCIVCLRICPWGHHSFLSQLQFEVQRTFYPVNVMYIVDQKNWGSVLNLTCVISVPNHWAVSQVKILYIHRSTPSGKYEYKRCLVISVSLIGDMHFEFHWFCSYPWAISFMHSSLFLETPYGPSFCRLLYSVYFQLLIVRYHSRISVGWNYVLFFFISVVYEKRMENCDVLSEFG